MFLIVDHAVGLDSSNNADVDGFGFWGRRGKGVGEGQSVDRGGGRSIKRKRVRSGGGTGGWDRRRRAWDDVGERCGGCWAETIVFDGWRRMLRDGVL